MVQNLGHKPGGLSICRCSHSSGYTGIVVGYLGKGTPTSNPGQAHANTLVLTQPQLHVLAVHAARRPLLADAPLTGLA